METIREPFRLAPVIEIFAGQLDGGLVGLGTGIAEKDAVRKTFSTSIRASSVWGRV
jgi:hypothetical protein